MQAHRASLTDHIVYYVKPSDPTNPGVNPQSFADTHRNARGTNLRNAIAQMLRVSDNRITKALQIRFGLRAINATAKLAGMAHTTWTQILGTGIPGNYLTLEDAGKLYAGILNGSLLNAAMRQQFQTLILNQSNAGLGDLTTVIQQEAGSVLGTDSSDSRAVQLAADLARMCCRAPRAAVIGFGRATAPRT